jgi:hypothetical protein
MSIAYFSASTDAFRIADPQTVLGILTRQHRHALEAEQRGAWVTQIEFLQEQLPAELVGTIYFEFIIPRMGKRADVVLLLADTVAVLEFKVGAVEFSRQARAQRQRGPSLEHSR